MALRVHSLHNSEGVLKQAAGGFRSLEQRLVATAMLRCQLEHANMLMMYAAFKVGSLATWRLLFPLRAATLVQSQCRSTHFASWELLPA